MNYPILHKDLFELAEMEIKQMEKKNESIKRYKTLMKLYDQADVINDIV